MVATDGKCHMACTAVASSIASSGEGRRVSPGIRGSSRVPASTTTSVPSPISVVGTSSPGIACSSDQSFSWKCSVGPAACSPKKSFHCPTQMITAMPVVKPTITGSGMNLMTPPSRPRPIASRMAPAISVATCRPAMPYCAVMPASTAMKAPVGPEICTRVPPSSAVARPAMIAV